MDSELDVIISDIAKNAFIEKPEIVCTYETGRGEGYMGRVKMFDISDKQHNTTNKSKKLSIIVKLSPLGDEIHSRLPVSRIFQTEITFYSKIAPALCKFQSEYGANCYNFVKCFYSNSTERKETLIIENLTPKGYSMLDREVPMKETHMMMAFEQLAKFHALSFAMKTLRPQAYEELKEPLNSDIFVDLYKIMRYDTFLDTVTGNFRKLFIGSPYYKTFCDFSDRIVEEFNKCNIPDEYSVICHGDTWCNNILYTHDSSGTPTSAILIDFQLSKVLSPAADLSYLFYGCVDIALLPRLNDFLKAYHKTMAASLAMFGLDVEQVYPWRKLLEHWKSYGKLGMITSFLMRVVMMNTPDESPDLSEAAKGDGSIMMAFYFKMKRELEYNHAVQAVFQHCIDEKYIY